MRPPHIDKKEGIEQTVNSSTLFRPKEITEKKPFPRLQTQAVIAIQNSTQSFLGSRAGEDTLRFLLYSLRIGVDKYRSGHEFSH